MFKKVIFTQLLFILLITSAPIMAQNNKASGINTQSSDPRVLISIPEESLQLMRKDMIGLLSALTEIMQSLSTGDFEIAASIAENRMGKSAMGKHRGSGMGPGRFMPIPMRDIAWGLHDSASEFAKVAIKGDVKQAYSALNQVISHCAACHNTYRTK